jgi:hypothetical protein
MLGHAVVVACVLALCGLGQAGVPVYVMMPLDTVNNDASLNDPAGITSNLQVRECRSDHPNFSSTSAQTMKSIGVTGIMMDVWWGIVEQNPQAYNFSAYARLCLAHFHELFDGYSPPRSLLISRSGV